MKNKTQCSDLSKIRSVVKLIIAKKAIKRSTTSHKKVALQKHPKPTNKTVTIFKRKIPFLVTLEFKNKRLFSP